MCRFRRNHRGDRCVESPMTIDEPTATPELVFRRDALSQPGMSPERFAAEFRLLRGEAHIGRGEMLTARQRVIAIASAAQGDPVVGGQAAMVMHGSRWFDSDFPILLIRGANASGRAARGSIPCRVDLPPEHIEVIDGIAVTSPIRTAFDVGRIQPRMRAIGHLDALAAATAYDFGELADYVETQKGVRYVRQLKGPCCPPRLGLPRAEDRHRVRR